MEFLFYMSKKKVEIIYTLWRSRAEISATGGCIIFVVGSISVGAPSAPHDSNIVCLDMVVVYLQ